MTFAAGFTGNSAPRSNIYHAKESRDNETAETAVRAALTGHLVFVNALPGD